MKVNEIFYSLQGEGKTTGLPTVFIRLTGCNLRCSYCDTKYAYYKGKELETTEIIEKIEKYNCKNVCITGGEPLLQKDIAEFTEKIKKLGYLIKIDTNGTYPEKLKELIDKKLVDYIAMDIKAPKNKYSQLTGTKTNTSLIEKSIEIIKKHAPNYEFKTTFIPQLLKKEDIIEIAKWIQGAKKYYLQQFKTNTSLLSPKMEKTTPYTKEYLIETLEAIKPYFKECHIRGI